MNQSLFGSILLHWTQPWFVHFSLCKYFFLVLIVVYRCGADKKHPFWRFSSYVTSKAVGRLLYWCTRQCCSNREKDQPCETLASYRMPLSSATHTRPSFTDIRFSVASPKFTLSNMRARDPISVGRKFRDTASPSDECLMNLNTQTGNLVGRYYRSVNL